jgi:hypothetical protein
MGLPFPECADDKDKAAEKEKMKQMLKDAKAAAGPIPASAQKDVAAYLKKMQDYIDTVIDGLPPCTGKQPRDIGRSRRKKFQRIARAAHSSAD